MATRGYVRFGIFDCWCTIHFCRHPDNHIYMHSKSVSYSSLILDIRFDLFSSTYIKTTAKNCIFATHLVVRNSMSLLVFSSDSVEDSSSSSRSAEICGRFPMLPPRLTLEEVEDELSPESATGDACHSRRKSNPPVQKKVCIGYTTHADYKQYIINNQ